MTIILKVSSIGCVRFAASHLLLHSFPPCFKFPFWVLYLPIIFRYEAAAVKGSKRALDALERLEAQHLQRMK